MVTTDITLLQKLAIFGGISNSALTVILNSSERISKKRGELFFIENDEPDGMYVLENGKVEVFKTWQAQKYHVSEFGPGSCFGEMSLVDMGRRSGSVIALTDSKTIKIPTRALIKLATHDMEQLAMIHMNMGREICRRLRKANERLFDIVVKEHSTV
ncbi:MAG: cyclic nucleotide-binding domain-containing protein [Lentisphaeraceae bacterium]|nr:cyclic nucleotide-binding domain-containing protein [Lentisphaeraceae bacterium]